MKENKNEKYCENDEENVQMLDLHHLYYMKKEMCADIAGGHYEKFERFSGTGTAVFD